MSKKPTQDIVFINEASSLVGMGHILRSQTLAKHLLLREYNVSGITIGEEKAVLYADQLAKHEGFILPTLLTQDVNFTIKNVSHNPPNLVVVDCDKLSQDIVLSCIDCGIKVVALDYFISEQPLPAAVINLIDHNPLVLSGLFPIRNGVDYYQGPEYGIIRNEFLAARERRGFRTESLTIKRIVVTFGGADPAGNTKKALDMIFEWPGNFMVDIIIGPLFELEINSLSAALREKCSIACHESPSYIGKLFEDADLVFCGGGGTLLEAICVGVPVVVIAQNESELMHSRSLAIRGACTLFEDLKWEFINLLKNRIQQSNAAKSCVDGLGYERICDIIEKHLNY